MCRCQVRLTNENFYYLTYPAPLTADGQETAQDAPNNAIDYAELEAQAQRSTVPKDQSEDEVQTLPDGMFRICGMVDGVTDALSISDDDEWTLTPIVVEVKNRLRSLRNPPPLYDLVQMAVYMKMLGVTDGDLVQCLHGADEQQREPTVSVSRVSLSSPPLSGVPARDSDGGAILGPDLWTGIVLPRLYTLSVAIAKLRDNELLRLAFLNGSPAERQTILRAECDFL